MNTHAQEAKRLLKIALSDQYVNSPAGYNASVLVTQRAQVHATLELAEQQRISNLIALGRLSEYTILKDEVSADAAASLVEHKERRMGGYFQLKPEIVAALGIEQDS